MELKTSQEWQEEYPDTKVLDPDGWDRENFQYTWYKERITKAEYLKRVLNSTCSYKIKR